MKTLAFLVGMLLASTAFAQTPTPAGPTPAQRLMSDHAATENARAHEWESTVAWDKEIQAQLAAQAEQIKWWSECWDGKIPGCSKSESQAAAPFYTKSPPGHSEPQATAPENSVPNADLTKSYRAVSPTR